MSTRKRTKRNRTISKSSSTEASTSASAAKQKQKQKELPASFAEAPDGVTRSELPPPRPRKEVLTPVAPPGRKAPLRYFIYTLVTAALLFAGWYTYITAVGLKQWKDEVGWWGVTVGRYGRQDTVHRGQWRGGHDHDVEGHLEGHLSRLASALGIPATDVASAVKPLVPPATLSSLAPRATGEAVKVFFEEDLKRDWKNGGGGTFGSAAEGLGKVVGFDDPLVDVEL